MFHEPKDSGLHTSLSDEELALLVTSGFVELPAAELLRRHAFGLYHFTVWQCRGNLLLAENIALRSWERFLRHIIGHGSPDHAPQILLLHFAHNQWLDVTRRQSGLNPTSSQSTPGTDQLSSALLALPDKLREVAVLHFICELTLDETRQVCGSDIPTLASLLDEAQSALLDTVRNARGNSGSAQLHAGKALLAEELKKISPVTGQNKAPTSRRKPPGTMWPLEPDSGTWRHFIRITTRLDAGQRDRRQKLSALIRKGRAVTAVLEQHVSAGCAEWIKQQAREDLHPLHAFLDWSSLGWIATGAILAALATRFYLQHQPSDIEALMLQTFRDVAEESGKSMSVRQIPHTRPGKKAAGTQSSILAFILLAHLSEPPGDIVRRLPKTQNTHYRIFCADPENPEIMKWIEQFRQSLQQQGHPVHMEVLAARDVQHDTLRIVALSAPSE